MTCLGLDGLGIKSFTFTFNVTCFDHYERLRSGCRPPWREWTRQLCIKYWGIRVRQLSPWSRTFLENLKLPTLNFKFHYDVHKSPQLIAVLILLINNKSLNPLLVTHFKNILPSTSRFSLKFVTKVLCIFNVYPMPTHLIILDFNTLFLVRTSAYELSRHTVFFSSCLCLQFNIQTYSSLPCSQLPSVIWDILMIWVKSKYL